MKFLPINLKEGDFARRNWSIVAEQGMTPDMLAESATYSHIQPRLKRGDHIEVTAADGSWYAELLVRASADGAVQVGPLSFVEFEPLAVHTVDDYDILAIGSPAKFRVVRKADGHVMVDGLESKLKALQWIERPVQQAA